MQAVVGFEGRQGKEREKGRANKADKSIAQVLSAIAPVSNETGSAAIINKAKVNKDNSIAYLTEQANIAAQNNRVTVEQSLGICWVAEKRQWQMRFKTNKDIGTHGGASSITVNAATGKVEKVNFGYQSSFGSKVDQWLSTLHMGNIGNGVGHLLYQVFLALIGLAVAVLSGTGVYLWYKGRQQRLKVLQKLS